MIVLKFPRTFSSKRDHVILNFHDIFCLAIIILLHTKDSSNFIRCDHRHQISSSVVNRKTYYIGRYYNSDVKRYTSRLRNDVRVSSLRHYHDDVIITVDDLRRLSGTSFGLRYKRYTYT